jgi:WD40 repeat protein
VTGPTGYTGYTGPAGPTGAGGALGYYGSFYSTQTQTASANTPTAMTLNVTDIANGVLVVSNSRITFTYGGVYNLQFSAQLHYFGGGGSGNTVNIWLRRNGADVPNTDTKVSVTSNNPYTVPAWNFVVPANAGEYYELIWSTDNASIHIEYGHQEQVQ